MRWNGFFLFLIEIGNLNIIYIIAKESPTEYVINQMFTKCMAYNM